MQRLLDPRARRARRTVVLRDPRPGDMGWVVQQHGELYAREYGYNSEFEALVAEIAAQFLRKFDPTGRSGWIAELDGERVGSVFVVRKSATVAQLRLLILRAAGARPRAWAARLTDECIAFARAKGYRKMVLWTNSHLDAARAIYASRGFRAPESEPLARLRAAAGRRNLGGCGRSDAGLNLALWAAAATGVQVGAAIVASRFVVAEVPPLTLAMLRYAIGFACLLPFALARAARRASAVLAADARPGRDGGAGHRAVRHADRAAELRAAADCRRRRRH